MQRSSARLTGVERVLLPDELVVSKTDTAGRITYANRVFMRMAGYGERDLLGAPHNIVRHPDMPRCIFKLLWECIKDRQREIFAYVVNRSSNGDHYWVLAHVTPTFDGGGSIVGYHSSRRAVRKEVVDQQIVPLYRMLLDAEAKHSDPKEGLQASTDLLTNQLKQRGMVYDEFVFSI